MNTELSSMLPVTGGTLTLDASSAPGEVLGEQLAVLNKGLPLVVRNATRVVTGDHVTVTGEADLLGVADLPVTATAAQGTKGPEVTVRFSLISGEPGPNSWRFQRSFPQLPDLRAGAARVTVEPPAGSPAPNILDTLILSDTSFQLSTGESGTDELTGAPLRPGLNFSSRVTLADQFGLLGAALSGGAPVTLSGAVVLPKAGETTLPFPNTFTVRFPWQLSEPVPGIHLSADLGIDLTVGNALRLHDVGLRLYCPASKSWAQANPTYPAMLGGVATLELPSAGMSLDLTAVGVTSPTSLMLLGAFEGITLGRLTELADLVGADDLASYLPEDVQRGLDTLGQLSLRAAVLQLGPGFRVLSAGVSVALPGLNTSVLPGFTLRELVAHFSITQPFSPNRRVTVSLGGKVDFLGAPFSVSLSLPGVTATARLLEGVTLPLGDVFGELGLPSPADLTVSALELRATKDGSMSFAASMADAPGWTIDLGPVPLTASDVHLSACRGANGGASSASLSGTLALGKDLTLAFGLNTPGDFLLRGELPDVSLMQLVRALTNQKLSLPGDFDLQFEDSSVMVSKSGKDLAFQLATTMDSLGTVAFEARRVGSQWGFAAGVDLSALRLSSLPGLSALALFESFFQLDQLLVVMSSFEDPAFSFPSLAAFNAPTLRTGDLKLPAQAGGVVAGLNVYARWTLDTASREQKLLKKLLGLQPSLGITLQVGKVPSKDSRLYVSYDTRIQGMPLSCQFGGQLRDGQVGLFLNGKLEATIQSQPVRFDVTLLFVANGAFMSGTMKGSVSFAGLTLSNLALVVGMSWEAIPSVGVAATISSGGFQSSVAVLFDSTDPSRSMLAGSVSDLSLKDVVDTFAKAPVPTELSKLLSQMALVGTSAFTVGLDVGKALDNQQLDVIAAAFQQHSVTLPSSSSDVLIVQGKPGKLWFLTDLRTLFHYRLERTGEGIRVTLDPQLYVAPQATFIGTLRYEQGFFVNAGLKLLGFDAMAKVLVKPTVGISADGAMDPIVLGHPNLFSLTSATDSKKGPHLSLATFHQRELKEPVLQGPHCVLDGQVSLLGWTRSAFVTVSSSGFACELEGTVTPGATAKLKVHFDGPTTMDAGGEFNFGVGTVDLGPLGKVKVDTQVKGQLSAGVSGKTLWLKLSGSFEFMGARLQLPRIELDATTATLAGLVDKGLEAVANALRDWFRDPLRWAQQVGGQIITGVIDVGQTLQGFFGAGPQVAALAMRQANAAAGDVATALNTLYKVGIDDAAQFMRDASYSVHKVGEALGPVYKVGAKKVGRALKRAGCAVDKVGNFLKETYGMGPDQLEDALSYAEYSKKQIGNFFKDLGGEFEKAGKKILDGLGSFLDGLVK